ncbi:MAG: TonB-dependent receptor [Cyanobacteria bacterium P01_F01_bin.150]
MNLIHAQNGVLLTGMTWLIVMQPVAAEIVKSRGGALGSDRPLNTDLSYLSEIKSPLTTIDPWTAELAQSTIVQIIGVQIKVAETGIDIVLNTPDGQLATPTTSVVDNALIADIPNAVLSLPEGDKFQADDPAAGLSLVTVSSLPNGSVRVVITGVDVPPVASVNTTDQGLVLSATPSPGGAAEASEVAEAEAEADSLRIIVTAQRTEEDVQDVPISITVLTDQDVEDAGIDTFRGVADNTPNYTVFDATGGRFFDYYSLRGLSNFNFSSRDAVGFFIDDVPYDYGGFLNQNLVDIERVEVLRGPQNTLYGRSSQAGAINVITRRPTNQFEFNGTASYSSFENFESQASVSGPIVEDQLRFRLSGSYGSRNGYYKNLFLANEVDDESGGNVRGQMLWTPSENLEVLFNASYDDYFTDGVPLNLIDSEPFELNQDINGFNDLTSNTQSLRVEYSGADLRFTSITARRYSNQGVNSDLDQTTLNTGRFTNEFTSTVFSQEVRLQSPETAARSQWLAGAYYESRSFNTERDGFNFGTDAPLVFGDVGIPGASNLRFADIDEDLFAVFGQGSYQLADALTLTAGLRYETITSTLDSFERIFSSPGVPDQALVSFDDVDESGDILLPRAALEYRFNPNVMAYASIARGYRPGGVNFRPENADTITFEPERSWNFEMGLKSSWLNDRLGINLAVFHNPVNDYQVITFDPVTVLVDGIENADASITGFELEARTTPLDGLDLTAGFGLADANFTNYPNRPDLDGNALPFAPEFTYNLGLQYRSPMGLLGRIEVAGLGKTFFDEANTLSQDPYAIVNARLGYEADTYGVYLFVNNLFDTEYTTFQFSSLGGTTLGLYGVPSTVGMQFRARL